MPVTPPAPPARGLDRIEIAMFLFGIIAFAVLMLAFGQPLAGDIYLPVVALWVAGGIGFIWWFNRHLASKHPNVVRLKPRKRSKPRH